MLRWLSFSDTHGKDLLMDPYTILDRTHGPKAHVIFYGYKILVHPEYKKQSTKHKAWRKRVETGRVPLEEVLHAGWYFSRNQRNPLLSRYANAGSFVGMKTNDMYDPGFRLSQKVLLVATFLRVCVSRKLTGEALRLRCARCAKLGGAVAADAGKELRVTLKARLLYSLRYKEFALSLLVSTKTLVASPIYIMTYTKIQGFACAFTIVRLFRTWRISSWISMVASSSSACR